MTAAGTGLYAWISRKTPERASVWTVAGYGAAGLLLNPDGGARSKTDLSIPMASASGRSELFAGDNQFRLAFKAEAL